MRLGVLADTHIQTWPMKLLEQVKTHFQSAELILHAGDIVNMSILEMLPLPVVAVAGNSDTSLVQLSLPRSQIVECRGFRIGLMHGYGAPQEVPFLVAERFAGQKVDAIVFGHSHEPFNREMNGVLMFNPGSLSGVRSEARTLGILDLDDKIKGSIIEV